MPDAVIVMDIIGHWDLDRVKISLGGAITFTEELASLSSLYGGSKSSLFFTGRLAGPLAPDNRKQMPSAGIHRFHSKNSPPMIAALLALAELNSCHYSSNFLQIIPIMGLNSILWSASPGGASTAGRGAMLYLQDFYDRHGRVPRLRFKQSLLNNVIRWIDTRIPGRYPVTVHMKKSGPSRSQSNAHWPEWRKFLQLASQNRKMAFILIGNDPVPADIELIPNVITAKREGLSLAQELALVTSSYFFMGMSSGPGQAAVLSDVPYVLYKHPAHHRGAMDRELQGGARLRFSTAQQRFRREPETAASLMREFRRMDTPTNRRRWQERISRGVAAA